MSYSIGTITPIILLPFFAFVINLFISKKFPRLVVIISCLSILGSLLYSLRIFKDFIFNGNSESSYIHKIFTWFDLSGGDHLFRVDIGVYIDNMTVVTLLMVTGVAFLIHLFSTYYMKDDIRRSRFFVYMSLFTSAMLGLVLSDNLFSFFIFWEIMGFCSYSLIGFYYEKEGAGNASLKAFMTTRIGDVFFLLGIVALWTTLGSVSFVDIYEGIANDSFSGMYIWGIPILTFVGFSLFMATIGKSAQVPLQVWLPDAMWGPTPCSALIHAATMVAAGVYLLLRSYPIMEAGGLLPLVAYVGAITAFVAATIAVVQKDIKAVLAFSTISQLGYMVLGVGVGAYNPAFMHLITHAVFKACLFLSAGSIIHSLHDTVTHTHVQDMPRMGGLRKKMPYTFFAMLLCTLAITGVPFFSGFVSKDRILGDALLAFNQVNELNWTYFFPAFLGYLGAFLTAFYMFRMLFLTFLGSPRDMELYNHTKKEKLSFNRGIPLLFLALFTLGFWYSGSLTGLGVVNVFQHKNEWFKKLIKKPNVASFSSYEKTLLTEESEISKKKKQTTYGEEAKDHGGYSIEEKHAHHVHIFGAIASIVVVSLGVVMAFLMYFSGFFDPNRWKNFFGKIYDLLDNKYYFDNFYISILIKKLFLPFNNFLSWVDMKFYDRYAVDGWARVNNLFYRVVDWFDDLCVDRVAVDGTGLSIRFFNAVLRTIQSGKIQVYIFIIIFILSGYVFKFSL